MGELAFITGEKTSAELIFSEESRYIEWEAATLRKLLVKYTELAKAFDALLSIDIARKLKVSNRDPEPAF